MYYNYHAQVKKKIKMGLLVKIEYLESYHHLKNIILLSFSDGTKYPIKEERWNEYSFLLKEDIDFRKIK